MGISARSNNAGIIFYAALTLYCLSSLILFIDVLYVLKAPIVVTAGRLSLVGINVYSFTGSLLNDQIVAWFLLAVSSLMLDIALRTSIFWGIAFLSLVGLLTTFICCNAVLSMILLFASISAMLAAIIRSRLGLTTIYSMTLALAVIEALKITYLAIKLAAGVYPWFSTPLYVNIVLWYYTWPLVPVTLVVVAIYGVLKILAEALPALNGIAQIIPFSIRRLIHKLDALRTSRKGSNSVEVTPLFIVVGILLSIAVALIPYAPTLNPTLRPVNKDWVYYYEWLTSMIEGNFTVLKTYSDRALFLLILYTVWYVFRIDPKTVAVYHNIFLLPLYVFSLYLLAKKQFDSEVASYVALITPFSPLFLSFIYGGFQANLLAISLVFISLYLLADSQKRTFWGLALFTLTMFMHEWTWTQFMIVVLVYVLLRVIGKSLRRWKLGWRDRALIYYLLVGYSINMAKGFLFGLHSSISVVERALMIARPMSYLDSAHFFTTIFTGGTLCNPPFYILLIFGLAALRLDLPTLAIVVPLTSTLIRWNEVTYRLILNTPLTLIAGYAMSRLGSEVRVPILVILAGIGLWRLYSIIPGLGLTP